MTTLDQIIEHLERQIKYATEVLGVTLHGPFEAEKHQNPNYTKNIHGLLRMKTLLKKAKRIKEASV